MERYRSFRTRLKVNNRQANVLAQWCGISRLVYNTCLDQWECGYKNGIKYNYFSIKKWFNAIKRNRFPFITDVSKCVPESAIRNLSDGYKRFFKGQNGHPKFHKKGTDDSFRIDGSAIHIEGKNLRLPKKLNLHMMEKFRYEENIVKINNVTVSRKNDRWWASISCIVDMPDCESQASGIVGIDLGIKNLAICSDGTVISNPRQIAHMERRQKHLQRSLARKVKGSNNREKACLRLGRYIEHMAARRSDYMHKATSHIARKNGLCFMEDLNVSGMMGNHHLSKAIADASMYEFKRQLSYKTNVRSIDRWEPSSQLCSGCGTRKPMPLSERTYICDYCGMVMDRDLNAAVNILHIGMANYPESMPVEGGNPGLEVSGRHSMKQEPIISHMGD